MCVGISVCLVVCLTVFCAFAQLTLAETTNHLSAKRYSLNESEPNRPSPPLIGGGKFGAEVVVSIEANQEPQGQQTTTQHTTLQLRGLSLRTKKELCFIAWLPFLATTWKCEVAFGSGTDGMLRCRLTLAPVDGRLTFAIF